MSTDNGKQAAYDMLVWLETNATSVRQALVMAAENNEAHAKDAAESDQPALELFMRQSATAWRKHAEEFEARYEKLDDPDALGLV